MQQSTAPQSPERQRTQTAWTAKRWGRWLLLGVLFFVIVTLTNLVTDNKDHEKLPGTIRGLHARLDHFNTWIRHGLDSIQPFAPLRSFVERFGDDYHWSVWSWQAPFNVTRMRQQYQDALNKAFINDPMFVTLKKQEPLLPPKPSFQGSLAAEMARNPASPKIEAWMQAQETYQAAYGEYERAHARWLPTYMARQQGIQRAVARQYPQVVVDSPASYVLPQRLRALLFGLPDATMYMVQQTWARQGFNRFVFCLVPVIVVLVLADAWNARTPQGLGSLLGYGLGVTLLATLAVSIGAAVLLAVLSVLTGTVLGVTAAILGICALPFSSWMIFLLMSTCVDLLKEFCADRLLSRPGSREGQ